MSGNDKQESSSSSSADRQPATNTTRTPADDEASHELIMNSVCGDRATFQHAIGLKMTPEDIDKGDRILDRARKTRAEEEQDW